MKFLKIVLLLFICLLNYNQSSAYWVSQLSDTSAQLNSVHFVNNTTGWAVGLLGKIIKTTNAGQTWEDQSVANTNFLTSVNFVNTTTGYAVGLLGMIVKTTNGGTTWNNQLSMTTNNLLGVKFISLTTGWAVGSAGTILKTTFGGTLWNAQTSNTTQDLAACFFVNANTGWAVGNAGTIVKTVNGGSTWTPQTSSTTNVLLDVFFIDANTGWIAGTDGLIMKTINGGTTWTTQNTGTTEQLSNVHFVNSNLGWAVGANGKIIRTTNGGATWTNQISNTQIPLLDVHFADADNGWAVGWGGTVLKYSNLGLLPPNLLSPANTSTGISLSPTLSWSVFPNASSYRVQVSTSSNFSSFVVNAVDTGTSIQLNNLLPQTQYFWRLCSKDGADSSAWSLVWSFTTRATTATQLIALNEGWNMISLNVVPTNTSMSSILAPLSGNMVLIKNMNGEIFAPPMQTSLNTWNFHQAYMIKMASADTLAITGIIIDPQDEEIELNQIGWYWLPYLRNSSAITPIALGSIAGKYHHIKNIDGTFYQPPLSGSLQQLEAGRGYIIRLTANDGILIYPSN